MPIVKSELAPEAAPAEGHFAVVTSADGEALAVPPGAFMYIVPDPKRPDRIIPVVLQKVTRDVIQFRCACRQEGCTRVLSYKLRVAGHHPGAQ